MHALIYYNEFVAKQKKKQKLGVTNFLPVTKVVLLKSEKPFTHKRISPISVLCLSNTEKIEHLVMH